LNHKPTWFLKEMDKISLQIDKIDDCSKFKQEDSSPVCPLEPKRSMTRAQELKFMRKFGVSTKEVIPTSPVESTKSQETFSPPAPRPQSARPRTPQGARPRTPVSARQRPQSAASSRPQSAGPARPQSAGPRIAVTARFAMPQDGHRPESANTQTTVGVQDFSDEELRNELLERRAAARAAQGLEAFAVEDLRQELLSRRARSHRRARSVSSWSRKRSGEPHRPPMDREWDAPSIRFNSTSNTQSVHSRSTMSQKLDRAKKMAELLDRSKSKSKRSKSAPRGGHFRAPQSVGHEKPFRVY